MAFNEFLLCTRHNSRSFIFHVILIILSQVTIIPILQIRKQRHQRIKEVNRALRMRSLWFAMGKVEREAQ